MLAKSALLLSSVMCFSFHKNFGAESRWQYVARLDASQPDLGNKGVAQFINNKPCMRTPSGHIVEAYNDHQRGDSFAKITFQKNNQGKTTFLVRGCRLYPVHPLVQEGDKVSLYIISHDHRYYKYIFALRQKPAEAKEEV